MKTQSQPAKSRPVRGFTLIDLLIVIVGVLILAAMFLPALARSKARSSRINCANGLKQIGLAFRTWSLDNSDHFPMQVSITNGGTMEMVASGIVYPHFQVMSNELSTPKILICPEDQARGCATNFDRDLTDSKLSYFVNVAATNGDGSNLLAGDRNITNRAAAGGRLVPVTKGDTIAWTKEIHDKKGNLLLGDGSVGRFINSGASPAIRIADGTTNWLAVP